MNLTRATAPAATPVSLAEVKDHLRVEHNEDDALITLYLGAAVAHLDGDEGILGRALVTQTWDQTIDDFPHGDDLALMLAGVQSVTSITYRDMSGATQTFPAESYMLRHRHGLTWVHLKDDYTWPETDDEPGAVTVRFVAGYGDAAAVPAALKAAMLLHVGHMYENREPVIIGQSVASLPMAYDALVAPYRVRRF